MSPRVQVPLAGAACLAALAALTLQLLDVPALSPSAARLGVGVVAAGAYPLLWRVFVGAADRLAAFRWAVFAPIVLAAITGDAVYFALRVVRPDVALSFAQMRVDGQYGFVPVTILSALAGASGAAVLAGEVAFVLRARAADPANGGARVVVVAWGIAAAAGALAALAGATWGAYVPAIGVAALAVRALLSLFVRRSPAPARSPYRG